MKKVKVKTVILEENHELFLTCNKEIWDKGLNAYDNTLLHFDEHSDMFPPRTKSSIHDIKNENDLIEYTYTDLGINNFIVPLIFQGVFNRVYWINNNRQIPKPTKRCVRTFNNEGKKFIIFNPAKVPSNSNIPIKKFVLYPVNINNLKLISHKNIVLDISLNYFSCVSDPSEYTVNYIEITKDEYDEFLKNEKYHNLKFELLGHRISVKIENGKYYYVLNDHEEIYSSVSTRSKEDIQKRIRHFVVTLSKLNIIPSLITVTRSVKSGYTSEELVDFIQKELISNLEKIYSLELSNIDSYFEYKTDKLEPLANTIN